MMQVLFDSFSSLSRWDVVGAFASMGLVQTFAGQHATLRYIPAISDGVTISQAITLGPVDQLRGIGLQAFGSDGHVWIDGRFAVAERRLYVARQEWSTPAVIIAESEPDCIPTPQEGDIFGVTIERVGTDQFTLKFYWYQGDINDAQSDPVWQWTGTISGADAVVGSPRLRLHPGSVIDSWRALM